METVSTENARQMLLYVADKIIENKPYLTEVDSAIGDGDHGIGMALGFTKVKEKLQNSTFASVNQVFSVSGRTLLMSMGGASGVIFGSMFLDGAKAAEEKELFGTEDFARLFRGSLDSIKQRGGASVGDKTMVDALEPAVSALENNAGRGLLLMFGAASAAALDGVEKTKEMIAKFGRAKSLMARSIGHQDAGATSVWIIFCSMSEYIQKI